MIIACPACTTRYVVPDTAIGLEGRTVRCAKCRHSWFQDPPELAQSEPEPAPAAAPEVPRPLSPPPVDPAPFALARPDLQLDFPADQQERRQLPNGTEYFGASGTITNVGGEAQSVPPILIVLRDGRDRIVYSFEVQPPKRSLAPGESVT